MCIHIYIYIYIYTHTCICICIYIYICVLDVLSENRQQYKPQTNRHLTHAIQPPYSTQGIIAYT